MKIVFRKRKIESASTFITYVFLVLIIFLWILYKADDAFHWDILSQDVQQFIERFIIPSLGFICAMTFCISLMLNLSLLSESVERIAEKKEKKEADTNG
jgi:amino acid permease